MMLEEISALESENPAHRIRMLPSCRIVQLCTDTGVPSCATISQFISGSHVQNGLLLAGSAMKQIMSKQSVLVPFRDGILS